MYSYKNKQYELLYEGQMKTSNGWVQCIIYKQVESGLIFCREIVDFYFKFELV